MSAYATSVLRTLFGCNDIAELLNGEVLCKILLLFAPHSVPFPLPAEIGSPQAHANIRSFYKGCERIEFNVRSFLTPTNFEQCSIEKFGNCVIELFKYGLANGWVPPKPIVTPPGFPFERMPQIGVSPQPMSMFHIRVAEPQKPRMLCNIQPPSASITHTLPANFFGKLNNQPSSHPILPPPNAVLNPPTQTAPSSQLPLPLPPPQSTISQPFFAPPSIPPPISSFSKTRSSTQLDSVPQNQNYTQNEAFPKQYSPKFIPLNPSPLTQPHQLSIVPQPQQVSPSNNSPFLLSPITQRQNVVSSSQSLQKPLTLSSATMVPLPPVKPTVGFQSSTGKQESELTLQTQTPPNLIPPVQQNFIPPKLNAPSSNFSQQSLPPPPHVPIQPILPPPPVLNKNTPSTNPPPNVPQFQQTLINNQPLPLQQSSLVTTQSISSQNNICGPVQNTDNYIPPPQPLSPNRNPSSSLSLPSPVSVDILQESALSTPTLAHTPTSLIHTPLLSNSSSSFVFTPSHKFSLQNQTFLSENDIRAFSKNPSETEIKLVSDGNFVISNNSSTSIAFDSAETDTYEQDNPTLPYDERFRRWGKKSLRELQVSRNIAIFISNLQTDITSELKELEARISPENVAGFRFLLVFFVKQLLSCTRSAIKSNSNKFIDEENQYESLVSFRNMTQIDELVTKTGNYIKPKAAKFDAVIPDRELTEFTFNRIGIVLDCADAFLKSLITKVSDEAERAESSSEKVSKFKKETLRIVEKSNFRRTEEDKEDKKDKKDKRLVDEKLKRKNTVNSLLSLKKSASVNEKYKRKDSFDSVESKKAQTEQDSFICKIRNEVLESVSLSFKANMTRKKGVEQGKLPQEPGLLYEYKDGRVQLKWFLPEFLPKKAFHESYDFQITYYLSLRLFDTPKRVLVEILKLYDEEITNIKRESPIRLHNCVRALTYWISHFPEDFDDEITHILTVFLRNKMSVDLGCRLLLSNIQLYQTRQFPFTIIKPHVPVQKPFIVKTVNFEKISALEFARQLTLIEFEMFQKIRPVELLGCAWSKKDKELKARNVIAMTAHFNRISSWVQYLICSEPNTTKRVTIINKLISICVELYNLHNINAVFEFCAGLNGSAVVRMKKTWEQFRSKDKQGLFQEFQKVTQIALPASNYSEFRETLTKWRSKPAVPYPGVFLQDLTFIEDGNKSHFPDDERFLNFVKLRLSSDAILRLLDFQRYAFPIESYADVREYIGTLEGEDEQTCFDLSLKNEPREK